MATLKKLFTDGRTEVKLKHLGPIILLIIMAQLVVVDAITAGYGGLRAAIFPSTNFVKPLYLMDRASRYVSNTGDFEQKVKQVSQGLNIPPEWLMAVMYSESRFDASVSNFKGSGAVGLIQWMPATAKDFGLTPEKLKRMNHSQQLDYVFQYLDRVKQKYRDYQSLTDLYLAILYPKALAADPCFTLYADPSIAYKQNAGLDWDKDGRVTIKDIDKRMMHLFKPAYQSVLTASL